MGERCVQHLQTIENLAEQAYARISAAFPVCTASDEFYFFPQSIPATPDWRTWDDFSPAGLQTVTADLNRFEQTLAVYTFVDPTHPEAIDATLLQSVLRTLREQLLEVAPHRNQPTFHLTILVAGLSEALAWPESDAWTARIAGVSAFLSTAAEVLESSPLPFLAMGHTMVTEVQCWLEQLQTAGKETGDALAALTEFTACLAEHSGSHEFTMPEELFGRVVRDHFCSGLDPDQARRVLLAEYEEMDELLRDEAARLAPGRRWQELEGQIPFCEAPQGDLLALYRPELLRLEHQTLKHGLVPDMVEDPLRPTLVEVPTHLLPIRASDAYSARPGYPAQGGTFFVYPRAETRSGRTGRTLEYRMTAAHETWPGHHLLDLCRWNLSRPVRRPIERPFYYEGWACFAEELMAQSGYFDNPWDRFLLARRRIERAARGLIDLGLQSGRMRFADAGQVLVDTGYTTRQTKVVLPRYILRPGYQVCYTLGLRKMLELFSGSKNTAPLARSLLAQGQLDFATLETLPIIKGED